MLRKAHVHYEAISVFKFRSRGKANQYKSHRGRQEYYADNEPDIEAEYRVIELEFNEARGNHCKGMSHPCSTGQS